MQEIIKHLCQYSHRLENIEKFTVDCEGQGHIQINGRLLEFDSLEEFRENLHFCLKK